MSVSKYCRIGLCGTARVGKDAVCDILLRTHRLPRVAYGDFIKADMDAFIREKFGFSAFTEKDSEKSVIRPLLVEHGYARYDYFLDRLMGSLPDRCVNARVFRLEEAVRWKAAGGILALVQRPGVLPAEPKEMIELNRMRDAGLITHHIMNSGTLDDLANEVSAEFRDALK